MLGRKQAFVSKYETGVRGVDVIDFLKIAGSIGCDAGSIIAKVRASDA